MRILSRLGYFGVFLLMALLAACDTAPGPEDLDQRSPVLSGLSFSPQGIVLDNLPPEQIEGDHVVLPLTISVTATDLDGQVEAVFFIVQSPVTPGEPLVTGTLSKTTGNRFSTTVTVRLPKSDVGGYTILVYAVDPEQHLSNDVRGLLRFEATGQPPVITAVEAIPAIVRPPTTLRLVATVTDPDGLRNISQVEVTTPSGQAYRMFDDGRTLGDAVANDGRYTASFDVPAASPGIQTFRFQATDRSGLKSNIFEKQITVE